MIEKLRNMSDFKLAFIMGLLMYLSANIGKTSIPNVELYIWITANAMAGAVSILIAFTLIKFVKIMKKIIK